MLVTHSATAMALCTALLGLPSSAHMLGPLANCHWSELRRATRRHRCGGCGRTTSALPGVVVPLPVHAEAGDEASDADA